MDVLIFLVPLALLLGLTGLLTFVWALRSGQFDDPDGAALRVLSDDDLSRDVAAHAILNDGADERGTRPRDGESLGNGVSA